METTHGKWQKILQLTTIGYALLVLISFIGHYVYYILFHVHIGEYMELSELLMNFLDDLPLFVSLLIFYIFYDSSF